MGRGSRPHAVGALLVETPFSGDGDHGGTGQGGRAELLSALTVLGSRVFRGWTPWLQQSP